MTPLDFVFLFSKSSQSSSNTSSTCNNSSYFQTISNMVFTFVAGAVAGAGMMKMYQYSTCDVDTTETKKKFMGTASRATELNRTLGYTEEVDTTDGAHHVNFLSDVVARLWPYMGKAIATAAREAVEPSFKDTLPGPLSSLKFKKLELGDVPIVIDNILVRQLRKIDDAGGVYGKNGNYLQFEWDITWQSDCDIQLATDKIAGMAAISFGVKTIELSGRMQVICKPLSDVLPCVDAVQFAFVNPPQIELDFTGLANLADMKLQFGSVSVMDIRGMVRGIVDDILAQSMVLPTRIPVPLVDNVDYRDIFAPQYKGMARIRLHSGRGFQVQKATRPFGSDDIPDVYVKIRVGVEPYFKSSVCKDNCNPEWDPDENFQDFLVCQYRDQILELQAWDEDTGTLDRDDHLGFAHVTLGQVMLNANRDGLFEIELMQDEGTGKNKRPTGQFISISMEKIAFTTRNLSSMSSMALMQSMSKRDFSKMSSKDRKKYEKREASRIVGLNTILVSHAENLPFATAEEANTFVKVYLGSGPGKTEVGVTPPIPGSLNPQYMYPISVPLTVESQKEWNKSIGNQCYCLELFQQDLKTFKHKSLGEIIIDQSEVKVGEEWALRETRSVGKYPRTQLAFTISYAGVDQSLSINTRKSRSSLSRSSIPSLTTDPSLEEGIEMVEQRIRVRVVRGYGFQSEKKGKLRRKMDVPDVYCMIKYGSSPNVWRTPTIKDSETPTWDDECRDFRMESMNEVISIEVWDENRKSADDYYGTARTSVAKVLLNNGILDVPIREDNQSGGAKRTPKKKSMAESNMFITVECMKL